MQTILTRLKNFARKLKQNLFILYFSYKDNRVPWYAKVVAILVVGYAFSPIDLIPDFIPILGYIDDLIIVPLGISLALKLIPPYILEENRDKAEKMKQEDKPKNWIAGTIFIFIWGMFAYWIVQLLYKVFS